MKVALSHLLYLRCDDKERHTSLFELYNKRMLENFIICCAALNEISYARGTIFSPADLILSDPWGQLFCSLSFLRFMTYFSLSVIASRPLTDFRRRQNIANIALSFDLSLLEIEKWRECELFCWFFFKDFDEDEEDVENDDENYLGVRRRRQTMTDDGGVHCCGECNFCFGKSFLKFF